MSQCFIYDATISLYYLTSAAIPEVLQLLYHCVKTRVARYGKPGCA